MESDHGDPFTLLKTYNEWLKVKTDQQTNSRQWCRRHGLEEQRFYEITKLRKQFEELLKVLFATFFSIQLSQANEIKPKKVLLGFGSLRNWWFWKVGEYVGN